MNAVTKAQFKKLTPHDQGFVAYMQGAWNKNISDKNPYRRGSAKYKAFATGMWEGMLLAQDSE